MKKRILIVGGIKNILERAQELDLDVVYFQKKGHFDLSYLHLAEEICLIDYEDIALAQSLALALHNNHPFAGVFSLTETGLLPSASIRQALGFSQSALNTARLLKDKFMMRKHLNHYGISPVPAALVQKEDDIYQFLAEHNCISIMKPRDGTGSMGIMHIRNKAEGSEAWRRAEQIGIATWIIEEYLEGSEVSVEAFSFAGKHIIIGITDKQILPNFVEVGHTMPADIDPALYSEITTLIRDFLDSIGLQDGPSHTELKITAKGPKIIESHNRIGGDKITNLLKLTYGIDMVKMSLEWGLGMTPALEHAPQPLGGAAIRFFTPPPGIVRHIYKYEHGPASDDIQIELNIHVGDQIPKIEHSEDRVGFVLAGGSNASIAAQKCQHIIEQISFVIE